MYVSGLLTLTPARPGEETIPAKKTKTLVSQMHQTEVEQVGPRPAFRASAERAS